MNIDCSPTSVKPQCPRIGRPSGSDRTAKVRNWGGVCVGGRAPSGRKKGGGGLLGLDWDLGTCARTCQREWPVGTKAPPPGPPPNPRSLHLASAGLALRWGPLQQLQCNTVLAGWRCCCESEHLSRRSTHCPQSDLCGSAAGIVFVQCDPPLNPRAKNAPRYREVHRHFPRCGHTRHTAPGRACCRSTAAAGQGPPLGKACPPPTRGHRGPRKGIVISCPAPPPPGRALQR